VVGEGRKVAGVNSKSGCCQFQPTFFELESKNAGLLAVAKCALFREGHIMSIGLCGVKMFKEGHIVWAEQRTYFPRDRHRGCNLDRRRLGHALVRRQCDLEFALTSRGSVLIFVSSGKAAAVLAWYEDQASDPDCDEMIHGHMSRMKIEMQKEESIAKRGENAARRARCLLHQQSKGRSHCLSIVSTLTARHSSPL
jgi:hypothetical protein